MQTQAELFLNRAIECEKRASQNQESGTLKTTLLTLADYYRQISKQASRQNK